MAPELLVDDPILPPMDAARYLGFRGDDPTRSLRRLKLKRSPLPGTGSSRHGYRRSVLNQYLTDLENTRSRLTAKRPLGPRSDRGTFERAS